MDHFSPSGFRLADGRRLEQGRSLKMQLGSWPTDTVTSLGSDLGCVSVQRGNTLVLAQPVDNLKVPVHSCRQIVNVMTAETQREFSFECGKCMGEVCTP